MDAREKVTIFLNVLSESIRTVKESRHIDELFNLWSNAINQAVSLKYIFSYFWLYFIIHFLFYRLNFHQYTYFMLVK